MNVGVCFLILAMLLTPALDGVAKTLSVDQTPMMTPSCATSRPG